MREASEGAGGWLRASRLIVRVKLAALVTALAGAVAMTLASCPAGAHGEADWISKGGFKTAAGTTCCTEKDCGIIYPRAVEWEADRVRVVFERDGVLIELRIPKGAVRPNPHDVETWLCALPSEIEHGEGRCLFLPTTAALR